MYPVLFAEIDWSQAFTWGMIGGGGALVLAALIYFFKAMTSTREESHQFEANQAVYLGSLGLGIALVVGGLYFRGAFTGTSDSSSLSSFTEFVSKEGKFKAKFPGTPREKSQNALGLKIKMFMVEEKDGAFGVAYIDLPSFSNTKTIPAETLLSNARDGMLHNVNAKLVREDRIALQGKYPGREIKADVPSKGGEMFCSIYLVDDRAYQVLIIGKSAWLNSDKARKFLNSFSITK